MRNKIKTKNTELLICIIAVIQIFLLINMTAANSYEIDQSRNLIDKNIINTDNKKLINFGLNLLTGFLTIKQIGIVFAQTETNRTSCCLKMKNGAICQDVLNSNDCESGLIPTQCTQVAECKIGCCFDTNEGLCSPNSPKEKCESDKGKWDKENSCNIEDCKKGCCVLGKKTEFATETRCNKLSGVGGFKRDFRQISEIDCLLLSATQEQGACILDKGKCVLETEAECLSNFGEFHKNYLCSNPALETGCEKQKTISCVEGKDEIYWFDSCGNKENIYSSDKDKNWNNGMILKKSESCNPSSGNIENSDCGNCNYYAGSTCSASNVKKIKDGNFICKDLRCIDENGKTRQNGESWCVYDSYIGDGKDTVGSRHWRRMCIDGEIKVEPCADYRNQVCAEAKTKNEAGIEVSISQCRVNMWRSCLEINGLTNRSINKTSECEKNADCMLKEVDIDKYFKFSLCVPKYSPGFDFWKNQTEDEKLEETLTTAQEICALGNVNCKAVLVDGDCKANCECLKESFTQKMNNFCTSLGDCGAYINYEGEVTAGGYNIKNGKKLSEKYLTSLKNYSKPVAGQIVEMTNYTPRQGELLKYVLKSIQPGRSFEQGSSSRWYWWWGGGGSNIKKIKVQFTCLPWQAPTTNQKCEECNKDLLKPCTEYRCKSLGAACALLNPDTENPICYEENPNDDKEPILTSGGSIQNLTLTQENKNITVKTSDKKCVQAFTPVVFDLETNEPAECRYYFLEDKTFEEMSPDFKEANSFTFNHTFSTMLPSLASLPQDVVTGELYEKIGNAKYYVRCQDTHGNKNTESYIINLCLSPEDDTTAPQIISYNPKDKSFLKLGMTETPFEVYLIEPAECRYDTKDVSFGEMVNQMNCSTGIDEVTEKGWACYSTLSNLQNETNTFYIRCRDQPWLGEDSKRNINPESFVYSLGVSQTGLEITSVSPEGVIENGFEPVTVELKAETSGGAENGKAICRYNFDSINLNGEFFDTDSTTHNQKFSAMMRGTYKVNISCEDSAGNEASIVTEFEVKIDTESPIITRMYKKGSELFINTNEDAICYYDTKNCISEKTNSSFMSYTYSKEHSSVWSDGRTYSIKCEDIWGNINPTCSIIKSSW